MGGTARIIHSPSTVDVELPPRRCLSAVSYHIINVTALRSTVHQSVCHALGHLDMEASEEGACTEAEK